MFSRVLYVSKALHPKKLILSELTETSELSNKKFSITGYLYFNGKSFLQYLEGPEKFIEQLMRNIRNDHRHKILYEKKLPPRSCRMFSDWSMRNLTEQSAKDQTLKSYLDQGIKRFSSDKLMINYFSLSYAESHVHNVMTYKDSKIIAG